MNSTAGALSKLLMLALCLLAGAFMQYREGPATGHF